MSIAHRLTNTPLQLSAVPAGLPLLSSEMYHVLGWDSLTPRIKQVIEPDLRLYVGNMLHGKPVLAEHEQRRRKIVYWVDCMRSGYCSEQTVIDALNGDL